MIEIAGRTVALDDPRLWAAVVGRGAALLLAAAGGWPDGEPGRRRSTAWCGRCATGSSSCTAG